MCVRVCEHRLLCITWPCMLSHPFFAFADFPLDITFILDCPFLVLHFHTASTAHSPLLDLRYHTFFIVRFAFVSESLELVTGVLVLCILMLRSRQESVQFISPNISIPFYSHFLPYLCYFSVFASFFFVHPLASNTMNVCILSTHFFLHFRSLKVNNNNNTNL